MSHPQPPGRIIISGCNSGPNPESGYGIARAIRQAFPSATIIALAHDTNESAIHDSVFDDVWFVPPFDGQHDRIIFEEVQAHIGNDDLFLPGCDHHVRVGALLNDRRLLSPSSATLQHIKKPVIAIGADMYLPSPDFLALNHSRAQEPIIETFLRRHTGNVWIKGSENHALPVSTFSELESVQKELHKRIAPSATMFLQKHISGYEESVAFCAYRGTLLDAVYARKRIITREGKNWGADVSDIPSSLKIALENTLKKYQWTGGGEIEMIREETGQLWLIDWNPRFPAWIYGATHAGKNLPALLVAAAYGLHLNPHHLNDSQQFIRVVQEISVRPTMSLGLHTYSTFKDRGKTSGKQGLRVLHNDQENQYISAIPTTIYPPEKIFNTPIDLSQQHTPIRIYSAEKIRAKIRTLETVQATYAHHALRTLFSYSIKTDPDPIILAEMKKTIGLVDSISPQEDGWAQQCGFEAHHIIRNGPLPIQQPAPEYLAHFADSLESFERSLDVLHQTTINGIRLALPALPSRFGVDISDATTYQRLITLLSQTPISRIGISFHFASSTIGLPAWLRHVHSLITIAADIERLTEKSIVMLDLGGGSTPEDFLIFLQEHLHKLHHTIHTTLPHVQHLIFEPGKALVADCKWFVTSVVERRRGSNGATILIVDGSVADIPLVQRGAHEMYAYDDRNFRLHVLEAGKDELVGRTCMEDDVLATRLHIPPWVTTGTKLVISRAGAYNTSMAYHFAQG